MQVHLVSHIARSLQTSNCGGQIVPGEPSDRGGIEATLLLSAVLDSSASLSAGQTATFGRCLLALLGGISRGSPPTPTALSNLLASFDLEGYTAMLLANPSQGGGLGAQAGDEGGWAREGGAGGRDSPEPPKHVAELLGLTAALFSLAGGHVAGNAVLCGLLGLSDSGENCFLLHT
jgi:hypothetical protein